MAAPSGAVAVAVGGSAGGSTALLSSRSRGGVKSPPTRDDATVITGGIAAAADGGGSGGVGGGGGGGGGGSGVVVVGGGGGGGGGGGVVVGGSGGGGSGGGGGGSSTGNAVARVGRKAVPEETVFTCSQCPYTTPYELSITIHRRMRHDSLVVPDGATARGAKRLFKCRYCSHMATETASLKLHAQRRHNDGVSEPLPVPPLSCGHCAFVTMLKKKLREHLVSTHGVADDAAAEVVEAEGSVHSDAASGDDDDGDADEAEDAEANGDGDEGVAGTTVFTCQLCPYTTPYEFSFFRHQKVPHEWLEVDDGSRSKPGHRKLYRCPACTHTAMDKPSLRLHAKRSHPTCGSTEPVSVPPLTCDLCGFKTMLTAKLASHARTVHGITDGGPEIGVYDTQ